MLPVRKEGLGANPMGGAAGLLALHQWLIPHRGFREQWDGSAEARVWIDTHHQEVVQSDNGAITISAALGVCLAAAQRAQDRRVEMHDESDRNFLVIDVHVIDAQYRWGDKAFQLWAWSIYHDHY